MKLNQKIVWSYTKQKEKKEGKHHTLRLISAIWRNSNDCLSVCPSVWLADWVIPERICGNAMDYLSINH
jgi:hypothetical protein